MNYENVLRAIMSWMNVGKTRMHVLAEKMEKNVGRISKRAAGLRRSLLEHREAIGYYSVLAVVLAALAVAAHDYRSRESEYEMLNSLENADSGIAVQAQPDQTLPPPVTQPEFIAPVQGVVIGEFSDNELTWSTTLQLWQTHPAVDIAAAAGESVVAAANGTVIEAYEDSLYGKTVAIDHGDGRIIRYASLNTLKLVEVGQKVTQGDIIGSVGVCDAEAERGTHLHIEYFDHQEAKDFFTLIEESD